MMLAAAVARLPECFRLIMVDRLMPPPLGAQGASSGNHSAAPPSLPFIGSLPGPNEWATVHANAPRLNGVAYSMDRHAASHGDAAPRSLVVFFCGDCVDALPVLRARSRCSVARLFRPHKNGSR